MQGLSIRRLICLLAVFTVSFVAAATSAAQPDDLFSLPGESASTKAPQPKPGEEVRFKALASSSATTPGGQFAIAIVFNHAPGWHTNPHKPVVPPELAGFVPIPAEITVKAPAGVTVGPIQWPPVQGAEVSFTGKPVIYNVYEGTAVAYIPIVVDQSLSPGDVTSLVINVNVHYQACDATTCVFPQDKALTVTIPTVAASQASTIKPVEPALFADFDLAVFASITDWRQSDSVSFNIFGRRFSLNTHGAAGVALLLSLAALGGLLLNLTPCVLPVIPIKIMGLSKAAGNPARCLFLGAVMSLGVIAFWIAIGGAIAFVAGFDQINALFQRPWFSLVVGVVIAMFALGALGLFTVRLPRVVYMVNPGHDSPQGSFLFGVMTAVLSTPCTAPFMGAASAWAATQKPILSLMTFGSIGVGMAIPYLLLAANPNWISKIPRTGPASELVKQVMGLWLLAVAAFFFGIGVTSITTTPPDSPSRIYWWLVFALTSFAGIWLAYRTLRITRSLMLRTIFGGFGAVSVAASVVLAPTLSSHGPIDWTPYTSDRFASRIEQGDVVVLDFTAEWCLNCKALETGVLHRKEIVAQLESKGVVPMKVDLTAGNPQGKAKLKELGWTGIPLLAIYGPGVDSPIKFGDGYTPAMVLDAIARAGGDSAQRASAIADTIADTVADTGDADH